MSTEPHIDKTAPPPASNRHGPELRVRRATLLELVELDPRLVVDGRATPEGLSAPPVTPVGTMRELCPHCQTPLKLVLRYRHVIRSHLYCEHCTRCYDALHEDGRSALVLTGVSID